MGILSSPRWMLYLAVLFLLGGVCMLVRYVTLAGRPVQRAAVEAHAPRARARVRVERPAQLR